ncbi:uncharacterized protein LOC112638552 isoform X2 [Camponotus floridanus]|uniref:uncharacterized protein LOC112638552 isoform X2 n=1 Tax=Camponotus floridanus TaxID=104421 RepID=UPI000DC6C265|nr:uncharacterized protein LOC112638552 isoform X2 [Camponotus floridanus]
MHLEWGKVLRSGLWNKGRLLQGIKNRYLEVSNLMFAASMKSEVHVPLLTIEICGSQGNENTVFFGTNDSLRRHDAVKEDASTNQDFISD